MHHTDQEKLKVRHTRQTVLNEASKARECHCVLFCLDPGWETADRLTKWDEARLGSAGDLAPTLRDEYQLNLGFRTVLRSYRTAGLGNITSR